MAEELTREHWLERRRKYIGGSDAAGALGMSRFKSQLQVYEDKLGKSEDHVTEAMERGRIIEPLIVLLYERRVGHKTQPSAWLASKQHTFMAATPDIIDGEINSLVQCKSADAWGRDSWGDDGSPKVPDDYMIQAQHEMAVCGATRNRFAVLFADSEVFRALVHMIKVDVPLATIAEYVEAQAVDADSRVEFCVFPIPRDDSLIATIIEGERNFWETYVVPQQQPPDASIPEKTTDFVTADKHQRGLIEKLLDAHDAKKLATSKYDDLKAIVATEIGEHAGIMADGIGKVTYKAPTPKPKTDKDAVIADWRKADKAACEDSIKAHTETKQDARRFTPRRAKG